MTNDLQVVDNTVHPQQIRGLNPQDMTELGAMLASQGWSTLAARALVAKVQTIATQVALAMTPDILDEVRKINDARMLEAMARVRTLTNTMGYVRLDSVIRIIQEVATRSPRQ